MSPDSLRKFPLSVWPRNWPGRDDITKIQYNKIIRKAPGEVSACVEEDVPVRNVRFAGGMNKKMETISDLHFQCSLRGSNPRPQH